MEKNYLIRHLTAIVTRTNIVSGTIHMYVEMINKIIPEKSFKVSLDCISRQIGVNHK